MNRLMRTPSDLHNFLKRSPLARAARSTAKKLSYAAMLATFSTTSALAQAGGTDPSQILQNIADFILGPFGQSLAILGIIVIGVSWMFGRASVGLMAGVIGGIVLIFGASFIATTVIGAGG